MNPIDIVAVARHLGLKPQKKNGSTYARCAVNRHEHDHSNPKCGLNAEKGVWNCLKCGESGDAVGLVKAVRGCEARDAFQWLEENGLKERDRRSAADRLKKTASQAGDLLRQLALKRGWTVEALQKVRAEADGDTVKFPMRSADRKVLGYKKRKADNSTFRVGGQDVKSLTEGGSHNGLFYPDDIDDLPDPVLITEGEADAVAALSSGYGTVVGTPGSTPGHSCTTELGALVADRTVVLAPDPDSGGAQWRDDLAETLMGHQCDIRFIPPEGKKDLDERLQTVRRKQKDPDNQDIVDPHTELQAWIDEARDWQPPDADARDYFEDGTFIPLRLAKRIGFDKELRFGFDPENGAGAPMAYRDGVWRPSIGLDVLCQQHLGEYVRSNRINETLAALKRDIPRTEWPKWNPHRTLINCQNGMFDPRTTQLLPHDPSYLSTFQLPVRYNPDADSDLVTEFLTGLVPEDCLELLCEMMGYLVVPVLDADKFFVMEGVAGTGKTTFLEAFLDLLGRGNWAQVTLQDLAGNRFAPARLQNKLVGTFDDLDSSALKSASQIKALTGGFPWLSVERKGQDAYRAPLYARLIFTCNKMPRSPDKTSAWYRRLCLIPFEHKFTGSDHEDKELPRKLRSREARETLFLYAVGGLTELMDNGWLFSDSETTTEKLEEYKRENDSVAAFVDERCITGGHFKVSRTLMFNTYRDWCEESGLPATGRNSFYRRLRDEFGFSEYKSQGRRMFQAVGLKHV